MALTRPSTKYTTALQVEVGGCVLPTGSTPGPATAMMEGRLTLGVKVSGVPARACMGNQQQSAACHDTYLQGEQNKQA